MASSMYKCSFYLFVYFSLSNAGKVEVTTNNGRVSGRILKTLMHKIEYYGFMGIPYAAPPIEELRFLPPQPVAPWNHVLDATKEKSACIQYNNNIKKGQSYGIYGSEDCLYLDVFTPNTERNKFPVLVFIHNENFRNSYNKTKDYGPDFFMEEDLVVVTIAHRLSIFGFLSLEDEVLPSNAGLKDLIEGLKWIQNNIEFFGGDASKVTLLGSQGGAVAIDMLLNSNVKQKLFHSIILQSKTSWNTMYLQNHARERVLKLAEVLNIPYSDNQRLLEHIQKVNPDKLFKNEWNVIPNDYLKEEQKQILPFGPVVEKDGGLITGYPEDDLKKIDVPILIGSSSLEGIEAAIEYLNEPRYLNFVEKDFPFQLPRRVKYRFDPLKSAFQDAVEDIKAFYFSKGKVDVNKGAEYVRYIGDVMAAYAVDYATRYYSSISSKSVFYYSFDYSGNLNENMINLQKQFRRNENLKGATTGDELCYLFKCPDLIEEYVRSNLTVSPDNYMQRTLVKLWANFVKFGNPTPDGDSVLEGLTWNPYNTETKEYLHIGKYVEVRRDLNKYRFNFWDRFLEKWGRAAKDGVVSRRLKRNSEL